MKLTIRFTLLFFILSNSYIFADEEKQDSNKGKTSSLFSKIKKVGQTCVDAVGSSGASVNKWYTEGFQLPEFPQSSQIMSDLSSKFSELVEGSQELQAQVGVLANGSYEFTSEMAWATAKQLPLGAYRIWSFDSSLEDIKTHMIVPLLGMTRLLRENSDRNPKIYGRVLARLMVFLVESELKLTKLVAETTTVALWGNAAALATVPVLGKNNKIGDLFKQPNAAEEVARLFTINVLGHIWWAMTHKGLSFDERLQKIYEIEKSLNQFIVDVSEQAGWKNVDAEVEAWMQAVRK